MADHGPTAAPNQIGRQRADRQASIARQKRADWIARTTTTQRRADCPPAQATYWRSHLIKVQGDTMPLHIELREGCLADPSLADAQTPCPWRAEAILRYPTSPPSLSRALPGDLPAHGPGRR